VKRASRASRRPAGTATAAPRFFATAAAFRAWLERHHASAPELLVGFHKVGSGTPSMTWPESVDEALCFGWIDGVRRRIDDASYTIRFSPRRAGSIWSANNTRRVEMLQQQGRMRPAGLEAFAARDPARTNRYSYERENVAFTPAQERKFRAHRAAWAYFQKQPPFYIRVCTWYVVGAVREETRERRLANLIACSERGEWLPGFIRPTGKDQGREKKKGKAKP